MAITEIQSASDRADNADKAPKVSFDNNPATGNLLIANITWSQGSGNASCNLNGWTKILTDGDVSISGKVRLNLFYKIAVAGESKTVKGTLSANRRWTIEIVEAHSTGSGGWVLDKSAHNSSTGTAATSGTTTTTALAEEYWVAGFAAQDQATLATPLNSFTIKEQQVPGNNGNSYVSGALLTRIVSATGTASTGGTYNRSRPWVGSIATFYVAIVTVPLSANLTGQGRLTATPYFETPTLTIVAGFGSGPGDPNPVWTDITDYVRSCNWQRGRQNELNQTQAGTGSLTLRDPESHFDPNNAGTAYAASVTANAPGGYWHLDEATGLFADSSGNENSATAVGNMTRGTVASPIRDGGSAVTLDGVGGYLRVGDDAALDLGDVFTLECWVKTTNYTATQGLISKGASAYLMRLKTGGGHLSLNLLKEGVTDICTATVQFPEDGQWHFLRATKNGSTVHLEQDGVDVTGAVTNATCVDGTGNLRIGTDQSGTPGAVLTGSIDEVAIYPTALTNGATQYDLRNDGSPFYPHVKPGMPIRATLAAGTNAYPLFSMFAERIPRTSRVTDRYTERQIDMIDGFALLANAGLAGFIYPEQISSDRVTAVLDDIEWSNDARQIGQGVAPVQAEEFAIDNDARAQTHLLGVNDSENGFLFCNGAGDLVFVGRRELISDPRYTVSQVIYSDVSTSVSIVPGGFGDGDFGDELFGDSPGSAMVNSYRYIDLVPSYDLDNVFNKWVVTPTDLEPQIWEDLASQQDFFLRVKQLPSLVTTEGEALNQAQWKSAQFSQPLNRVESITIMPLIGATTSSTSTSPVGIGYGDDLYGDDLYGGTGTPGGGSVSVSSFDQLDAGFGREVGDRITVQETPPGFSTVQENVYVIQSLRGQFNPGPNSSATLQFLLWPATVSSFWIVGDEEQSLVGVSTRPGY